MSRGAGLDHGHQGSQRVEKKGCPGQGEGKVGAGADFFSYWFDKLEF